MTGEREDDAGEFFDRFPRFLETSETGKVRSRLNGRYRALIAANRGVIEGARVLDLASHDGRWSFAALQNGATRVVGIEHQRWLVRKSLKNMEFYDVPRDKYEFVVGDIFECTPAAEPCDVVFCFGIFYHITDHLLLLSHIARLEPRTLIMDTNISLIEEPVVELTHEMTGNKRLVGWPSKAGLDEMFASFGWTSEYFDWKDSGLGGPELTDYWSGRRVTAVVNCRP